MSWNINRGFRSKFPEIKEVVRNNQVDIAFIIECDGSKHLEDQKIPGYKTVVGALSAVNNKVRIMAFVSNALQTQVRVDIMEDQLQTLWLEISRQNQKNILVGGIYREWSDSEESDLEQISSQVKKAMTEGKPTIVIGDMNFDTLKWDDNDYRCKRLSDKWRLTVTQLGLVQHDLGVTFVSFYTLPNGERVLSGLDHIYINDSKTFKNPMKLPRGMSDHSPVMCDLSLTLRKEPAKPVFIVRRSWKNFNQDEFLKDLANPPRKWLEVINPAKDVHQQAQAFDRILQGTLDRHAPLRRTRIREQFQKGLSEATKKLIRERDVTRQDLLKCHESSRNEILTLKFKKARNAVTSRVRKEAKLATLNSMKESGQPSEFWKAAKEVTKTKTTEQLKLKEDDVIIEDETQLSNIFNQFFKEKIEKIEAGIPDLGISPVGKLEEEMKESKLRFTLKTVSAEQVKKAINKMKNKTSSGIDFISPRVVKMAADVILIPLMYVINTSISSGTFPNSWKEAKVIPIYKNKGSKLDKKMYRPVSNLRSVSKVIELLVNKQLLNFLESNRLLPQTQHGFRAKRSTFSAVATMHEQWIKNKEKKEHQAVTFLDLSAAFDTLSKDIFCRKMKIYGFDIRSTNWFNSYLTDRSQSVMVGSAISEPVTINVGSPQGAILSPTIFIALISDIELWTDAEVCGYADDTSCTNSDKNINILVKKCEKSIQGLLTYMAVNRLSANDDKTHILVISGGRSKPKTLKLKFKIGQEDIEETEDEKLLGMWVSNDLKWCKHISKLEHELEHRLSTLKTVEQVSSS